MFLDLVLMLSWIVVGIIGGVWLNRKGYLMTKPFPDTSLQRSLNLLAEPDDGGVFGRIFFSALGGPFTLLAALLLPRKERHTR